MSRREQQYLDALRKHAVETLGLLSNPKKAERERMVVRAFLRCIGLKFGDEEIVAGTEEPIDVIFRSARFQLMDILGGRKRMKVWRDRLERWTRAKHLADILEPNPPAEPTSFSGIARAVSEGLEKKARRYGADICSTLDALVYFDRSDRYLLPTDAYLDEATSKEFDRQGWRSVSVVSVPYGVILSTREGAPKFLQDNVGSVLNNWKGEAEEGLFDS